MTTSTRSVMVIPAHLLSCIRASTPSTGLLLGSLHDGTFIIKQLVNIPWNETLALRTFYSDPELLVLGWFVQAADDKLTVKTKSVQIYFKETGLEMGLVRSYNELNGYCLAHDELVQECEVRITPRTGLPSFLQECYDLEPFIDDIRSTNQRDAQHHGHNDTPTLMDNHLIESYQQDCLNYEITVELYHLLMLPDEALIKRLQLLDAFEERKRRLESCFKDASLSPEQLMQCLASVNIKK